LTLAIPKKNDLLILGLTNVLVLQSRNELIEIIRKIMTFLHTQERACNIHFHGARLIP
jgi:hypothetical protein